MKQSNGSAGGRTPLFRRLARLMRQARFQAKHPETGAFFEEWKDVTRASRPGDASRRDFLKGMAALGLSLPVLGTGRLILPQDSKPSSPSRKDPVAIVGAGAAGLTCAYRLAKAGVPCTVFEGSERTGGRMLTRYDFNDEKMFVELGAELVDSNHADLIALAGELGLEIQDLREGDTGHELYNFGGQIWTEKEIIERFKPFAARIDEDLEGLEHEGEYTDKAQALDKMSLAEYLRSIKDGDKTVQRILETAYTIEYGLDAGEQSALNLIEYIGTDTSDGFKIFGESDESKRVKGGNGNIPNALAKAIDGKAPVHFGHRLAKIADDGKEVSLTFTSKGGASKTVKFGRVVLAIPFTMLRQVEGIDALSLTPEKKASIAGLGYGTNCKVMFGFSERIWRDSKATGVPACNGTLLHDKESQHFWETSRKQPGKSGILTNYRGAKSGLGSFTQERLDQALTELDATFKGAKAKHDGKKASWMWPTYEFTQGSYTCPKVGQVTTLFGATGTDELGGRLLFAGEHTSSDFSGFMNGAIESGNRTAKTLLG